MCDGTINLVTSQLKNLNKKINVVAHVTGNMTDLDYHQFNGVSILFNYGSELLRQSDFIKASKMESDANFVVPEAINIVLNYYLERCPGSRIVVDQVILLFC
jgi:hypothetical protein